MCTAGQLALSLGNDNGDLNGMSHSGVYVQLRNTGSSDCMLSPFPELVLADSTGPLKISFAPPGARYMHPGPVVKPVTLAAGAQVRTGLRWVSGPVYTNSVCLQPTVLHVQIEGTDMTTPVEGTICGESGKNTEVEFTRWQPVPGTTSGK